MQQRIMYFFIVITLVMMSCAGRIYATNGETIYFTGRNQQGNRLLDKSASRIKIVNSCRTCHGKNGDAMKSVSIKFSDLSSRINFETPYNDSLFFRFLDHDLRSDGTKANIGVIWKMTDKDKKDLLDYLKTL